MNVRQLMARLASAPDRAVALSASHQPITAAELLRWAGRWRAALPEPAGAWAVYHSDSAQAAAMVLALWMSGGEPWLAPNNLPATCQAMAGRVCGFMGEFPGIDGLQPAPAGELAEPDPQLPLCLFTSGSSGEPQLIRKQQFQLFKEVAALEAAFGASLGDALVVSSVSHQHIYGFLFRLLWPLATGRLLAAENLAYAEALVSYPGRRLAWVASPTHLTRLPAGADESRLAAIFSSGAPLPADASARAAQRFGAQVIEVFGSTETGGIGWRRQHLGETLWTPFDGLSLRVDARQQLEIRSPYLPDQQWHRCADRVRLEAGGFALLGRADRIVKVEGKRVSLEQLEAALLACPEIVDVRLEPLQRQGAVAQRDELLVLAVLSEQGRQLLQQGRQVVIGPLRQCLAQWLERPLLPRRWRFVDRLPRNAQGKLQQSALKALIDELMMEIRRD